MATSDKRTRKKDHRDALRAEREAAVRRQRLIRLGGVASVIAVLVALAVFTGGDDKEANTTGARGNDEAGGVACGAEAPEQASPKQYDKPEQVLEAGVDYRAVMTTSCGDVAIDLLEDKAPVTVNNFVFLAREGYFDGLTFHRIEPSFVIQGGDPNGKNGQPPDGPGYEIPDELWAKPKKYVYGTLAMANAGPDTGGSQFFIIVHEPQDQEAGLPADYSVFGIVDEASYDTLEQIAKQPTKGSQGNQDPTEAVEPVDPIYIESVEITDA